MRLGSVAEVIERYQSGSDFMRIVKVRVKAPGRGAIIRPKAALRALRAPGRGCSAELAGKRRAEFIRTEQTRRRALASPDAVLHQREASASEP
jgi:hypothetical protein